MIGAKLDFLSRLNELAEYARRGDDFFPDELCNFLVNEFDLQAALLFGVSNNNLLNVTGRSNSARKTFQHGVSPNCKVCKNLNQNVDLKLEFDPNCEIQISDNVAFESCSLIPINGNENFLLKIARKSAYTQSAKETLEKTLQLLNILLYVWYQSKGGTFEASTPISKIVSETSGELKSSANSIIGFISMLAGEHPSAAQLDYINSIRKNAQSILLNVNDLSELSKINMGGAQPQLKKVELVNFITEIIEIFKSKLGKKVTFTLTIEKELAKPIEFDDQKLRYVLTSLMLVSIVLTQQGEIAVKVSSAPDSKIKFSISDNGKTLKTSSLETFFEPFAVTKLDEFKNTSFTGLSLTLVKKYINYMGGDIDAASLPGKGNSFTFTISGEVMSDLETNISQLPKPTSKNKVLVIEDDYATSKLLSNYLNKWGYSPSIVSTESQAFNSIDQEELLAIILDIELPNVNGLELLKRIHDHPKTKNTPVIVCSIEPEQQKAFMMGAVEYFVKPINYNFLVEVLTNYKLRKNSNILCVDDDLPTLNLVKQAIESVGFVAVAENVSANVMELIQDKDIDLAIIDLDMPTPNGFELIKLIKSEKKFAHLPIIIYTGKENYKDDLYKIEGLFDELLEKRSTNIEDLADTINAMINRYETPPPVDEVIHGKNIIKILLAEDYKHSQIIVTRLLKKNNFESVVVVENGEDALKMAKDDKFDLILMDMQMPIMNGFEATEKIRELPDYKDTPIIALTAFAMKGDREKCLEAGATDYIPKPIDSKEFIEKVKYYTNTIV